MFTSWPICFDGSVNVGVGLEALKLLRVNPATDLFISLMEVKWILFVTCEWHLKPSAYGTKAQQTGI